MKKKKKLIELYIFSNFIKVTDINTMVETFYLSKSFPEHFQGPRFPQGYKNQYFHGLYELDYLLEIYNVFWVKYRNQWDAQQVKEQDKLRKHYLGQCECCLAMYQSLYDDDETVKRTKMKEMAKTLNVNELIDWSDEEVETEQELQEFNDLANRLALLK